VWVVKRLVVVVGPTAVLILFFASTIFAPAYGDGALRHFNLVMVNAEFRGKG
jgi:hypothetical protein